MTIPAIEYERIREEVQETFAHALELFDFEDIIDATDDLTEEEKEWAKLHLDWNIDMDEQDLHAWQAARRSQFEKGLAHISVSSI